MQLVSIELKKVYRQTDPVFIDILDHIRTSQIRTTDLALLNKRVGAELNTGDSKLSITLSTRRDTVDYINQQQLTCCREKRHYSEEMNIRNHPNR